MHAHAMACDDDSDRYETPIVRFVGDAFPVFTVGAFVAEASELHPCVVVAEVDVAPPERDYDWRE